GARETAFLVKGDEATSNELIPISDEHFFVGWKIVDGKENGAKRASGLLFERNNLAIRGEQLEHVAKIKLREVLFAADKREPDRRRRCKILQHDLDHRAGADFNQRFRERVAALVKTGCAAA